MIVWEGQAHVVRGGRLARWGFDGYGAPFALSKGIEVGVLTPPSTVAALAAGYQPRWAPRVEAPP